MQPASLMGEATKTCKLAQSLDLENKTQTMMTPKERFANAKYRSYAIAKEDESS